MPLYLTLSLAASPALQAMRVPRQIFAYGSKIIAFAWPSRLVGQALARIAHLTKSNDNHKEQFKDNGYAVDSNSIPTAGAVAIGLAMAGQHAMEEERNSRAIEKLDIYDIK